ncbi:MAG: hypothetical protein R3F07_07235 [Opitutaceae bacterium]
MDLLTNILIWAGILIAVVVVALAVHEFIWKPRQQGLDGETARSPAPSASPAVAAAPQPEQPAEDGGGTGSMVADRVPIAEAAVIEGDEHAPAPAVVPAEQFKRLSRSQRLGLARLTTMPASFDRVAGLAVAACKEADFDAILASGLIQTDPEGERFTLTEQGRTLGAEHLTPEDGELVRQFHTEHFSRLVEKVHATDLEDREAAVEGFELVQEEWPHLLSVLERLSQQEGREREFLKFSEAVNATGIFQTRTDDGIRWCTG